MVLGPLKVCQNIGAGTLRWCWNHEDLVLRTLSLETVLELRVLMMVLELSLQLYVGSVNPKMSLLLRRGSLFFNI